MNTQQKIRVVVIQVFFLLIGLYVAWTGVKEFDTAKTSIELLRGGVWIAVGIMCAQSSLRRLKWWVFIGEELAEEKDNGNL